MQALLDFAREVRDGLSKPGQRELPSIYLYDEIGTALFEAITLLPEYGLTRADIRLLQRHSLEVAYRMPRNTVVAELGSGTGKKTRHVLEALGVVEYYPIDISPVALSACEAELRCVAQVNPIH